MIETRRCKQCGEEKLRSTHFYRARAICKACVCAALRAAYALTHDVKPLPTLQERVQAHISVGAPDACWLWIGEHDHYGYGRLHSRRDETGRYLRAHRLVWELANGPIPDGLMVRHACDNPPCCNLAHLSLGTSADNSADRQLRGRPHGIAKLSHEQVRELRKAHSDGEPRKALVERFGVSRSTVALIVTRQTWRFLETAS